MTVVAKSTNPVRSNRRIVARKSNVPPVFVVPDFLRSARFVRFYYPSANIVGVKPVYESRRLLVIEVRDLRAKPLDRFTLSDDPLRRRGLFLVTGIDLDKGGERSFYLESMVDLEQIDPRHLRAAPLRLLVIDTNTNNGSYNVVSNSEIADPRNRYCETYNAAGPDFAIPIGNVA